MNIEQIDPNFAGSKLNGADFTWTDIWDAPCAVHGLAERFLRLPQRMLDSVSEGVRELSRHTAGGRARFMTDAARIALRLKPLNAGMMNHMPLTGSAGADVYINGAFAGVMRPLDSSGGWYEGVCINRLGLCDVEVNMPLYNGLERMYIGLSDLKRPLPPRPYAIKAPVVFYGSSITQGGCASRPGNAYEAHLSRWLNADHINLGFSGNARGETEMAEYIASLNMSAFVMDYDHNAPNAEHLNNTHAAFFERVRRAQPMLPIIIVTRPDVEAQPDESAARRAIAHATYANAKARGDERVWFIGGETLFGAEDCDACTVDGTHPNDLGFYRMARAIYPALHEALKLTGGIA